MQRSWDSMSGTLREQQTGQDAGAQTVGQTAQQWGQRGNCQGSHGWLSAALQIIVKILAFTLRKKEH